MRFQDKLFSILHERGETLTHMEKGVGVSRQTVYRGVKNRSIIAAIAYYCRMDAAVLVKGTELEEIWKAEQR